MVKYYQFKKSKSIKLFLEWLGVTENESNYILDGITNRDIWERNKKWEWVRKVSLVPYDNGKKKVALFRPFIKIITYKSSDFKKKYILIGRGKRI